MTPLCCVLSVLLGLVVYSMLPSNQPAFASNNIMNVQQDKVSQTKDDNSDLNNLRGSSGGNRATDPPMKQQQTFEDPADDFGDEQAQRQTDNQSPSDDSSDPDDAHPNGGPDRSDDPEDLDVSPDDRNDKKDPSPDDVNHNDHLPEDQMPDLPDSDDPDDSQDDHSKASPDDNNEAHHHDPNDNNNNNNNSHSQESLDDTNPSPDHSDVEQFQFMDNKSVRDNFGALVNATTDSVDDINEDDQNVTDSGEEDDEDNVVVMNVNHNVSSTNVTDSTSHVNVTSPAKTSVEDSDDDDNEEVVVVVPAGTRRNATSTNVTAATTSNATFAVNETTLPAVVTMSSLLGNGMNTTLEQSTEDSAILSNATEIGNSTGNATVGTYHSVNGTLSMANASVIDQSLHVSSSNSTNVTLADHNATMMDHTVGMNSTDDTTNTPGFATNATIGNMTHHAHGSNTTSIDTDVPFDDHPNVTSGNFSLTGSHHSTPTNSTLGGTEGSNATASFNSTWTTTTKSSRMNAPIMVIPEGDEEAHLLSSISQNSTTLAVVHTPANASDVVATNLTYIPSHGNGTNVTLFNNTSSTGTVAEEERG
jgi:hypothetical protein